MINYSVINDTQRYLSEHWENQTKGVREAFLEEEVSKEKNEQKFWRQTEKSFAMEVPYMKALKPHKTRQVLVNIKV